MSLPVAISRSRISFLRFDGMSAYSWDTDSGEASSLDTVIAASEGDVCSACDIDMSDGSNTVGVDDDSEGVTSDDSVSTEPPEGDQSVRDEWSNEFIAELLAWFGEGAIDVTKVTKLAYMAWRGGIQGEVWRFAKVPTDNDGSTGNSSKHIYNIIGRTENQFNAEIKNCSEKERRIYSD